MNHQSYKSLIGLLSLFLVGCTGHNNCTYNECDTIVAEDVGSPYFEVSKYKPADNDSSMIGSIYLGMNKNDFNKVKLEFQRENPTLSDLQIENVHGYFYKDKLIRVTIISGAHMNCYGGIDENYKCSQWTDLYKQKYRIFSDEDISPAIFGATLFNKGRCLIIVTDEDPIKDLPKTWDNDVFLGLEELDSNPLLIKRIKIGCEESEAALSRTPGARFSEKHYSRIDIIDKNFYFTTLKERIIERKKSKSDRIKKEVDLI